MEPLKVKVGDFKITFSKESDQQDLLYIVNWEKYFSKEKELVKNYLNEGDIAIDVGANLGFYTILLSSLVGNEGKVYSFEPSYKTFIRLTKNLELNKINNAIIENFGCGDTEGEFSLYKDRKFSGMDRMVNKQINYNHLEYVKLITLDKYFENYNNRIKLIKIDTEGFEPRVLLGAVQLIKKHQPVLVLELTNLYLAESIEAAQIISKELNYRIVDNGMSFRNAKAGTNYICLFNG
jgi:FkbM family methyltransferase